MQTAASKLFQGANGRIHSVTVTVLLAAVRTSNVAVTLNAHLPAHSHELSNKDVLCLLVKSFVLFVFSSRRTTKWLHSVNGRKIRHNVELLHAPVENSLSCYLLTKIMKIVY